MVVPLDSVQVAYNPPAEYPDNEQDKPVDGLALVPLKTHDLDRGHPSNLAIYFTHICMRPLETKPKDSIGNLCVPELVFGAANFSFQYNQAEHMTSDVPIRSVRLCMR